MAINLTRWVSEYENLYPGDRITYQDDTGATQNGTVPRFSSISSALQSRDFISRNELREIGRWKVGSNRIDHWLKSNTAREVEVCSSSAFQASTTKASIQELTDLTGVRVPVASAILTMYDPTQYAVVDFRAFRSLGAARPKWVNPHNHTEYVKHMEHYRNHETQSESYEYYLNRVSEIANQEGLSPREVDMALWAYDMQS